MGHRQWAGRPRVAYQPRGLDPFETLQIARTNLIAEAARIARGSNGEVGWLATAPEIRGRFRLCARSGRWLHGRALTSSGRPLVVAEPLSS